MSEFHKTGAKLFVQLTAGFGRTFTISKLMETTGKVLCLSRTIGSTTGGLVLYCACSMKRHPACMLFSEPIDLLIGAGAILADAWLEDAKMPVIDSLGEEFLQYVKDDMTIAVKDNGVVEVKV